MTVGRTDRQTDGQTAFELYIVENIYIYIIEDDDTKGGQVTKPIIVKVFGRL